MYSFTRTVSDNWSVGVTYFVKGANLKLWEQWLSG